MAESRIEDHPAYRLTQWVLAGDWGASVLGWSLVVIVLAVLAGAAYLWFLTGAKVIAAGWVWKQFWAARRGGRRHSAEYEAVMQSAGWRSTRRRAIRRSGHRCAWCGARGRLQGHHLTYARLGREAPGDVVALCDRCHRVAHNR